MSDWQNRIIGHDVQPASSFLAHPSNWRIHPQIQQAALQGSLDELGWIDEVIVNLETQHVLNGHLRISLALRQGADTPVPVKYVRLSPEEELTALAVFDPITGMATADRDKLDALLRDVKPADAALQQFLSDLAAKEGLYPGDGAGTLVDVEPQVDRAAALQEQWGTATGQVWVINSMTVPGKSHRLLCGNSASLESMDIVLEGSKVSALVTDPPFNVGFNYHTGFNDRQELDAYGLWLWGILSDIEKRLTAPWRVFVWQAILTCRYWSGWFPRDFRLFAGLKDFVQFRPTAIQYSWDPILFWSDGESTIAPMAGKRDYFLSQTSKFVREESLGHPCPRPIDVFVYIIEDLSEPGDIVDPFIGSGTAMVAAEQSRRICYGIEIDPGFLAITLQRLADIGLTPRLMES